jgi:ABC-type transport system substrate-binding protein
LLFEGLIEQLPDGEVGQTFRPVLAAQRPRVGSLSRDVLLTQGVDWNRSEGGAFDTADIVETLRLMEEKRTLRSAEYVDWLGKPDLFPDDPNRIRLKLEQGHPDPRELLTFKVLPGKYLAGKNKAIDDDTGSDSFARKPFGTGPYKLAPNYEAPLGSDTAKEIVFLPNGSYWRRPGRIGQPSIKEIRFVPLAVFDDPARELRAETLHMHLDVPTTELDRYTAQGKAAIVTAQNNRRIHFLAVNHNSPGLQSVDVRRGLALAIDREAILNDVYRGGKAEFHKALTGPFPAGSWSEKSKTGVPNKSLHDRDLAAAKLKAGSNQLRLKLLYCNDDKQAERACAMIAAQVSEAGGMNLQPEGVSPVEFRQRVEQQSRFDLAYTTFDYPHIWHTHSLAAFLDPTAAERGGRNYQSYLVKSTNPAKPDDALGQLFVEVRRHRDTNGELRDLSREVHDRFLEAMPFIPLWQLDRHMAVSNLLKIGFDTSSQPIPPTLLDPIRVFQNVSRWRMNEN